MERDEGKRNPIEGSIRKIQMLDNQGQPPSHLLAQVWEGLCPNQVMNRRSVRNFLTNKDHSSHGHSREGGVSAARESLVAVA